MFFIGVI